MAPPPAADRPSRRFGWTDAAADGCIWGMSAPPGTTAPVSAPVPAPATTGQVRRLSARVGGIAESATLAVDAQVRAARAAGCEVVGFGAGEPDFPTPAHIVEAAQRAAADPRMHHYTPVAGLPELREAIAAKTRRDSSYQVVPEQVLVTNGGKQAVYQAFAALLDPGDEVLLPAPYWTTYPEAIRLAGGVPVPVGTDVAAGYLVTVEQLEAARTARTRALLHCSPSNPTGAVMPPERVAEVGRWAAGHGLWVVADEIYEHLVYGGTEHVSLPVAAPEAAATTLVVNGVAKTYAMTGWRVGWLVGPRDVITGAINLQSHLTSNVCNVAQAATVAALAGGLDDVARMRSAFDRRRQTIVAMLAAAPGVVCPEPQGAFYVCPDVRGVLGHPLGAAGRVAATSLELAELLLSDAEVAVVPGEAFGAPGHLRLSYALSDADLERGVGRLVALLGG